MRTCHIRIAGLLSASIVLIGALVACSPGDPFRSTGAYPIDIFQEMHYNQTSKAQEPPRFLPPNDSYPTEGGFIPVVSRAASADLSNPFQADSNTMLLGALVYAQNCSSCHGQMADGDGPVGNILVEYTGVKPPAFDSDRVRNLKSGETYASLAIGLNVMPAFEGLLSERDRWALVTLIEATVSERNAALGRALAIEDRNGDGDNEVERSLKLIELRGKS